MSKVQVTQMQAQLLKGFVESEFHDGSDPLEFGIWSFSVIDNSGIDPLKACGSLASLKMKGIVDIKDGDKQQKVVYLTELGKQVVKDLGLVK